MARTGQNAKMEHSQPLRTTRRRRRRSSSSSIPLLVDTSIDDREKQKLARAATDVVTAISADENSSGFYDLADDREDLPELTWIEDDVAYLVEHLSHGMRDALERAACSSWPTIDLFSTGTMPVDGMARSSRRGDRNRREGPSDGRGRSSSLLSDLIQSGESARLYLSSAFLGDEEGSTIVSNTNNTIASTTNNTITSNDTASVVAGQCCSRQVLLSTEEIGYDLLSIPCALVDDCLPHSKHVLSTLSSRKTRQNTEDTPFDEIDINRRNRGVPDTNSTASPARPQHRTRQDTSDTESVSVSVVESVISVHVVSDRVDQGLMLTRDQMRELQGAMPRTLRYKYWKRLFSIAHHGDSFETFLRNTSGYSHTLMVLQTDQGDVLGGFADAEWDRPRGHGSRYVGTGCSFLFAVRDSGEVQLHRWKGVNDYNQICSRNEGSLGMGGGGCRGMFGLLVHSNFSRGASGPCETYGNCAALMSDQGGPAAVPETDEGTMAMIGSEEYFSIVRFEVYGFVSSWTVK